MQSIAIYGAGKYGSMIRKIYEERGYTISCFIISYPYKKHEWIDNIKVISIDDIDEERFIVSEIIVAMDEKNWSDVRQRLAVCVPHYYPDKVIFLPQKRIAELMRQTFPFVADSIFHTTEPMSRDFGIDRGTAIDRYYIERFLCEECKRIDNKNTTLEVGEDTYSKRYFPDSTHDILDYSLGMDLTNPGSLPSEMYDVFICTQTFHQIYDVKDAIYGAWKMLKYGGTLLATVCGCVSQLARAESWDHYWGFTEASFGRLLQEQFGDDVIVRAYGNSSVATAFIQGLALEEIDSALLDVNDNDFAICICAVAKKNR